MALANKTNSYFQDPNAKDKVVSVLNKSTTNVCSTERLLEESVHSHSTGSSDMMTPDVLLVDVLRISTYITAQTISSQNWERYFQAVTPARVAAHSLVVVRTIRRADLARLHRLLQRGVSFDGCNPQGESSLHLACRLGNLEVVRFLVEEARVNIRVRDDQGKTVLHDSCWTTKPNFALVKYILNEAPELLFLTDHRGYTALQYVPHPTASGGGATGSHTRHRDDSDSTASCCCEEWCQWITKHQDWLRQKVVQSKWLQARDQLDDAQGRLRRLMQKAAKYQADSTSSSSSSSDDEDLN